MYLRFYGLREEPFGATPDPRFLYASPVYTEAQATLEYGIRSGRGFTALIARPGMGKTTLLYNLLERYSTAARTAFIFLTQCDSREFMRYLMSELGTNTGESDIIRLQEQFGQLLVREAQAGKKVIAVVDEAQNLEVSVLETVRLLSDFETPRAKLLHIILTGQPELAERLASPALLQLRQRISHLVRLEPLSPAEVNRYIDHRLRVAGYAGPPLFTPEARALIVERSEGIPRNINTLCFNALSLGCALSRRSIGPDVVRDVSADLDFEAVVRARQEEQPEAGNQQPGAAAGREAAYQPAQAAESSPEQRSGEQVQAFTPRPGQSEEVHLEAATANGITAGEAAAAVTPPGPVLVPDRPSAAPPSEEVAKTEVGNLALRIMPAEVASAGPAAATAINASSSNARPEVRTPSEAAPGEGVAKPAAKPGKGAVDVEALAADCALFGLEEPKRWKRPVGRMPSPGNGSSPAARTGSMAPAAPRANVVRPVVTPLAPAANGAPGKAAPVNGSAKPPLAGVAQPPGRTPVKAGAGRLWPTPAAAAALNERRRRRQRSLYLAAGASLLLLLILVWLLSTSGPSTASQGDEQNPTVQSSSPQAGSPSGGGQSASSSDSSVLDVVQELPRPGGTSDTRPAVVMRGARPGGQLLRRVDPVYPAAAQANRIQGPVVLDATIGTHGFLRHIHVVSGDPLLADAVLDAVKGWRYRPRTVRGRPVESETHIVVNFQLVAGQSNSQQNP